MCFISEERFLVKLLTAFICLNLVIDARLNYANAANLDTSGNVNKNEFSCSHEPWLCYEANRLKRLINDKIHPCDDFFHFACGGFIDGYNLFTESNAIDMFSIEQEKIDDEIVFAINSIDSSYPKPFRMMKNYYQNCMEQEEDMNPILTILENIGGFPALLGSSWNGTDYNWREALYKVIDQDIQLIFPMSIGIFNNHLNGTKNIPMVINPQIYIKNSSVEDILKYRGFIDESIQTLGLSENISQEDIGRMIYFEIDLSNITSSAETIANQDTNRKLMTVKSLSKKYPSIPWLELFKKTLNRHNVSISSSSDIAIEDEYFIKNIEDLINRTSERTIANYIAWGVLKNLYPYLPKQFNQIKEKYRVKGFGNRTTFCLNEVKERFSIAVDAMYVRKYVAPHQSVFKDIHSLIRNIKKQIETNIAKARWIDYYTRKAALKKLHNMRTLFGFEQELLDDNKINEYYRNLDLETGSFLKSFISLNAFNEGKIYKSLYEHESLSWTTRRSGVNFNAEYKYAQNAIDIPVGFTQRLMYQYDRPQYLNYGALGSIVGHEINHGFDNVGRKYDENGYLNNWWTNSSEKRYMDRAQCLIDQFNNFSFPNLNLTVNGEQTLRENLADNGGFKAAYQAYNKWVESSGIVEKPLPFLNYTTKQLFWISSATNWCSKDGSQYLRNLINTDPHPPHYPRVILSFSNIKEFAKDFDCKIGSRMNPQKKCNLW